MSPLYSGDGGATLEVLSTVTGDGKRFRVERVRLGAVSVTLNGDELDRLIDDLVAFREERDQP